MRSWYDIACRKRNRTTVGASGLSPDGAAKLIAEFIEKNAAGSALQTDPQLPDRLRLACEEIKAYYFEAVSAQPGQPADSRSLADWFWGETTAALVLNRLREICLAESSGKLTLLGKLLLVPRNQLHRFGKQD